MKRDLERVCQGHHAHVPLEGQIPGGGGARSRAAENYPPALAKALAQMMVVDDDRDEADDVMVFGDEDAEMEQPMEVEKMPETSEGLDVSGSSAVPEDEKVAKNKALKTRVGARVFSYVARLHKNLGHPSPEVLHRMLDRNSGNIRRSRCSQRVPVSQMPRTQTACWSSTCSWLDGQNIQ